MCVLRVDSVPPSQDTVKSRELGSAALYDVSPSSCPEQPAVPSDVYAAADTHQEEGEPDFTGSFSDLLIKPIIGKEHNRNL